MEVSRNHYIWVNAAPSLWTAPVDDSDLISLDDAVKQFKVAKSTLFGWLAEDRLKRFRRLGDRRTFVSRRELQRLTEFREQPSEKGGRRGRPPTTR